jgi:hypothetical protein
MKRRTRPSRAGKKRLRSDMRSARARVLHIPWCAVLVFLILVQVWLMTHVVDVMTHPHENIEHEH